MAEADQISPDPAASQPGAARTTTPARFITFEGGEGVGKSTQIAHLAARLDDAGCAVTATREPGGTPLAEELRTLLLDPARAPRSTLAQALLFYAARADHLDRRIRPALTAGTWVLCDRFADSTRAYQGAAGGVDGDALIGLERAVIGETRPDLTILLDLDPRVGLMRANQRRAAVIPGAFIAADTFESRLLDYHQRLRAGYLAIAAAEPQRVVVIDAFQNELSIADAIWREVARRFDLMVQPGTEPGGLPSARR